MRQMKTLILVGLLGMVAAAPVSADWFFGAKTGALVVDSATVKDDAVNTGVVVGYDLGLVLGDLALEGELTTTTGEGKFNGSGAKLSIDTAAVYLAFRTAGPIYFKAKGGFLQASGDIDDSGASYGVGIGFGIGIAQLELEYTQSSLDPANVAFVSIGAQF
jgi:hypothetical protein